MKKHCFIRSLVEGGTFSWKVISFWFLVLFCFASIVFANNSFAEGSSFLISDGHSSPRVSKNEIKENIGEELKKSLYACTEITTELSNVQRELANLQRRILSKVESLVENKGDFKKARRKELTDAQEIMASARKKLSVQKKEIEKIVLQLNKNKCLRA